MWDPLGGVLGVSRIPDEPPNVMPLISNLRDHQGADTEANAGGFICKLELGPKYTRHSRAGTWTPRLRGVAVLWGPVANEIVTHTEGCTFMSVHTQVAN